MTNSSANPIKIIFTELRPNLNRPIIMADRTTLVIRTPRSVFGDVNAILKIRSMSFSTITKVDAVLYTMVKII